MEICTWTKWKINEAQKGFYCQPMTGFEDIKFQNFSKCSKKKKCPDLYYQVQKVASLTKCAGKFTFISKKAINLIELFSFFDKFLVRSFRNGLQIARPSEIHTPNRKLVLFSLSNNPTSIASINCYFIILLNYKLLFFYELKKNFYEKWQFIEKPDKFHKNTVFCFK